jgi:hypothetical protein
LALGTQFSIGWNPLYGRSRRARGAISLNSGVVSAGLRAIARFGRFNGRSCAISHLLHSPAAFGIALAVAGASVAANLSDAGVAQW